MAADSRSCLAFDEDDAVAVDTEFGMGGDMGAGEGHGLATVAAGADQSENRLG